MRRYAALMFVYPSPKTFGQNADTLSQGSTVEDCGKLFEEELKSTIGNDPTTVVVTQIRTAPAEGETSAQHKYTSLPGSPGASNNNSSLSTGAKVGIAIGAFALCGLIVAAVAFFILRKRRNAKYAGLKGATQAPQTQYDAGPVGGVGVFEPMRGQPGEVYPPDYKHQYMVSPQQNVVQPYNNQPPQQLGSVELNEMPGYDQEVHEIGGGKRGP